MTLRGYLPHFHEHPLPALYKQDNEKTFSSEREILYQVLFDMKKDMTDLKKLVLDIMQHGEKDLQVQTENAVIIRKLYKDDDLGYEKATRHEAKVQPIIQAPTVSPVSIHPDHMIQDTEEFIEESLSLEEKEKEMIRKALDKYNGKRKHAANELGISERTLYRKIKEYNIN